MSLIAAAPAHAQTAGTLLFGPVTFRLPNTRPIERDGKFSLPASAAGAYMLRVQIEPASGLTVLSLSLNQAPIVTLPDFAGVTRVDRPVNMLARNELEFELAGRRGTAITVSILTLQMPKPVGLLPGMLGLTLGQPGGTLSATLSPVPTAPGILNLTSTNPSVASVPATVAFAAGQSTVALPIAAAASGITTIHASANGGTASASVKVNAPPDVALTALAPNVLLNAPANFTLTATATDSDGQVAKVDFYRGDTPIASASAAPYSVPISNLGAGLHRFTAVAFDDAGARTTSAAVDVAVNALPTVSISVTGPAGGATAFSAPASIPISIQATDSDGTVRRVEVFANGSPVTTLTAAPFSFTWTAVPAGNYVLTAKSFDNNDAEAVSAPVSVAVEAPKVGTLYFIHVDHLNAPRLVADAAGKAVWRWDQFEPFGNNPPDENPEGVGNFELPLRLPGQYFDKETGLYYNYHRDYSPERGRYLQSDPIGLLAGINTYAYVTGDPLRYADPRGLDKTIWEISGGRGITDGPRNGNWCGGNWSGGWVPSRNGGVSGPHGPVDSLDSCCETHDRCWDTCEFLRTNPRRYKECRYNCDKDLVKCLKDLDPDCTKWPMPPRQGSEGDSQTFADDALRYWIQEVRKYESRMPK